MLYEVITSIKGLVPIIVRVPPRIAAIPMGMSTRQIGIFNRYDAAILIPGKNKTAAPVFCITLEIRAIRQEKMITSRFGLLPTNLSSG